MKSKAWFGIFSQATNHFAPALDLVFDLFLMPNSWVLLLKGAVISLAIKH